MGSATHAFPPVLPGAWASTWTLSPEQGSLDVQTTPRLSHLHMSDTSSLSWEQRESRGPAVSHAHNVKLPVMPASFDDRALHTDNDADAMSIDDDSSVTSDDFYSFISEQDTDSTLLSSSGISAGSFAKGKNSDGLLGPLEFDPSELSSALIIPEREDVLPPDASPPVPSPPAADSTRLREDNMPSGAEERISRPASPLGYCLPNVSACGQQLTASEPIDIITRSLSSGSPVESSGYECDSASAHSDFSEINYFGVSNLITRLDAHNASQASDISWAQSSPRDVRRRSRRYTLHNDDIHPQLNSQPSNLLLSQPDGDSPWTLFLDPTLTSTESEAVSHSSTTSLSLMSSFAFDDRVSRHSITPAPSLRAPFRPTSKQSKPATSPAPQEGIHFPVYGLEEPLQSAFLEPGASVMNAQSATESIRTKNFIQKTKNLCVRFKRMITLKAKKERKAPEIQETPIMHRPPFHSRVGLDITPPVRQFSPAPTRSVSSTERPVFQRTAKISSPSVALSYTPEYTTKRSMQSSEEKFAFDPSPISNTPRDVRSKRRFSLPAFGGVSSPSRPSTSSASPPKLSGSTLLIKRRKADSVLSADGRTMR